MDEWDQHPDFPMAVHRLRGVDVSPLRRRTIPSRFVICAGASDVSLYTIPLVSTAPSPDIYVPLHVSCYRRNAPSDVVPLSLGPHCPRVRVQHRRHEHVPLLLWCWGGERELYPAREQREHEGDRGEGELSEHGGRERVGGVVKRERERVGEELGEGPQGRGCLGWWGLYVLALSCVPSIDCAGARCIRYTHTIKTGFTSGGLIDALAAAGPTKRRGRQLPRESELPCAGCAGGEVGRRRELEKTGGGAWEPPAVGSARRVLGGGLRPRTFPQRAVCVPRALCGGQLGARDSAGVLVSRFAPPARGA